MSNGSGASNPASPDPDAPGRAEYEGQNYHYLHEDSPEFASYEEQVIQGLLVKRTVYWDPNRRSFFDYAEPDQTVKVDIGGKLGCTEPPYPPGSC